MRIHFDTSEFHGREPRGRGGWAFDFAGRRGGQVEWAPGSMIFSQARQWATARARVLGVDCVAVCS